MTTRHRPGRGNWIGRFWARGILYEKGGHRTKRAALEWEWAKRREVGATGPRRGAAPLTVQAAVTQYVAAVVATQASGRQTRAILTAMAARWGDRPLASLQAEEVRAYQAARLASPKRRGRGVRLRPLQAGELSSAPVPVKGATVNRELDALAALYSWARRTGKISGTISPASRAAVPRSPEPWRPWIILTPEQQRQLWALLPERERAKAQLLKLLGVRKGVVLGLRWEQLDRANRLLHYTSKGKSAVLPLGAAAIRLLETLGPRATGPVFPARSDTGLRRAWTKARLALGLPDLRRHDLRVAHARELHAAGVDLRTVQALLGHSGPQMTLRYVPSDLSAQRAALARLDDP